MDGKQSNGGAMRCPRCGKEMAVGSVVTGPEMNLTWCPIGVRLSKSLWPLVFGGKRDPEVQGKFMNKVRMWTFDYHPAWRCGQCEMLVVDYSPQHLRQVKGRDLWDSIDYYAK